METFSDDLPGPSNTAAVSLLDSPQRVNPQARASTTEEWNDEKNERRCDLIDKKIAGDITVGELLELNQLQRLAMAYRDRVAPLPMARVLRLHAELVAKKNGHQTQG